MNTSPYPFRLYPTNSEHRDITGRLILDCVKCRQQVVVSDFELAELERLSLSLYCAECAPPTVPAERQGGLLPDLLPFKGLPVYRSGRAEIPRGQQLVVTGLGENLREHRRNIIDEWSIVYLSDNCWELARDLYIAGAPTQKPALSLPELRPFPGLVVKLMHPYDGSKLAGKPKGQSLVVNHVGDNVPLHGPREPGALACLSNNKFVFADTLYAVDMSITNVKDLCDPAYYGPIVRSANYYKDRWEKLHPDPEQRAKIEQALSGGSIRGLFKGMFADAPSPEPMQVNGVKVCIFLERPGAKAWIPTDAEEDAICELEDFDELDHSGASGYYVLFRSNDIPTREQVDTWIGQLVAIRDKGGVQNAGK